MFDAENLAREFSQHVTRCPSGIMACTLRMAVESWFQMELASMLSKSCNFDSIGSGYDYPGTRGKADLVARIANRLIVFELKCFVSGADANKLQKWPGQLTRLVKLVETRNASQGVAVSTFYGYTPVRVSCFMERYYPSPWKAAGPLNFFENRPLQLVVATTVGQDPGLNG